MMKEELIYTSLFDPRARPLIEGLSREYLERYGEYYHVAAVAHEMDSVEAGAFAPPGGNFLLLLHNGEAVSGGAFMRIDERTAEFKRLWTRPSARRRGCALRVLKELELQAQRQGYVRIVLTTGFRQPEAVSLYFNHGYTALFDRHDDMQTPRALPFEKDIAKVPASDMGHS